MDKQIIRNMRQSIKEQLENLSSLKFQRKVWIANSLPGIWWDWSDAVCGYFDDLRMSKSDKAPKSGLIYHVNDGILTKAEANIIEPFNDLFDSFVDKYPAFPTIEEYEKILNDPQWIKITKFAVKILKKINFDKLPS